MPGTASFRGAVTPILPFPTMTTGRTNRSSWRSDVEGNILMISIIGSNSSRRRR